MSAPGTNKVDYKVIDGVAVVTLDHFPVNTLTNAVQLGIEDASAKIEKDKNVKAVIVRGAGLRALCAGADIQDLNKPHDRYPTKNFVECFEDLSVPVVALLQGFTLGGGFELCLGCHYRVITPNGFVGLPEVNIGLLPGGQGTQRLPRVVGVDVALQMMLTGQHVPSTIALKTNVVDKILSKDTINSSENQLKETLEFINEILKSAHPLQNRKVSEMKKPNFDENIRKKYSKLLAKRRNELAPLKILECVEFCCKANSFKEGVEKEQELFFEVLTSKQAKGLQHIFFAERSASKVPKEFTSKVKKIKKVGVIGAGTMGSGISMSYLEAGKEVILVDIKEEYVEKGVKNIKFNYERSIKRKSKTQKQVNNYLKNLKTTTEYKDLINCDLIIEAIFEDMKLKKEIFSKLDKIINKECIIASNTSYLNIDEIASVTSEDRKTKIIGMHFFSPANVMKLVEVIKGKNTSNETITTIMKESIKLKKWPVLVNNSHGFVGNRMLACYSQISVKLVLQGIKPMVVDKAAFDFGMPMGPLRMSDLVGLDIGYQARKRNGQIDENLNPIDAYIGKGRLGMKNGKGWYDYEDGRTQKESEEANNILAKVIKNNDFKKINLNQNEIQERIFFPIINEGFKVLEDKVAFQPQDIDAVFVHGYNWPRVTGGPMFHADMVGVKHVLKVLEENYKETGNKVYKPSKLLIDVVNSGQTLAKFWKNNQDKYKYLGPKPLSKL